jgi:hypothetical protein
VSLIERHSLEKPVLTTPPQGFFTVYRTLFELIALDEALATAYPGEPPLGPPPVYPPFGDSTSLYDQDKDDQAAVKRFYAAWLSFGSRKSFSSFDHYRTTEAPDRRYKRAMEKENKRARDEARKEYNETVRVRSRQSLTLLTELCSLTVVAVSVTGCFCQEARPSIPRIHLCRPTQSPCPPSRANQSRTPRSRSRTSSKEGVGGQPISGAGMAKGGSASRGWRGGRRVRKRRWRGGGRRRGRGGVVLCGVREDIRIYRSVGEPREEPKTYQDGREVRLIQFE